MRKRPSNAGVYALLVQVRRREVIRIGHLGFFEFAPGAYVYIGSALNSLRGRISRHFRRTKRKHWHIDYLLGKPGVALLGVTTLPTLRRLECTMARRIQRRAFSSIKGFGSSDCNCGSHLYYLGSIRNAFNVLHEAGWTMGPVMGVPGHMSE